MIHRIRRKSQSSHKGFSLVELTIVVAVTGILTAFAIPQMIAQRRLTRAVAVTREIVTQLRHARQLAMSQRQAFTFQYDDTTKQIKIIDHNVNTGTAVLTAAGYPNTAGSTVVITVPLTQGGLKSDEISYGIPAGLPTAALGDGISKTNLISSQINITFQPDGSVKGTTGNPLDQAIYMYDNYNTNAARNTASAISIVGASGRIKVWRYNSNANNTYAE